MEDDQWYLVDVTWDDKTTVLYNYFLIGSETVPSGYSKPVSQLRTVYTNFSNAKYTMTFTAPSLAEVVYHIHSWSNYQPDENATCTEDGTKTAVCDFEGCKVTDTQADTGSALGHSFLNYVSDGNATCTEDGTQTAQCERCDETDTQADADSALGHSFPSWQQIAAATVQKAAVLQRICTVCKVKEEKTSGTALTPTIQLTASSIRLKVKQSTTAVQVSGLAAGDFVVSWSSDDTSLVKVNQKGRIKAGNKTGTTYVNVTLASGLTRKIKVKVQKHSVKTTAITGIASKLKLNAGTKLKLTPVLAPITSIQKITYTSSNKKVASVSSKGVIRAKKAGRTTIRVKSGDKVVKCIVIVK
jgi:hypothetical protein